MNIIVEAARLNFPASSGPWLTVNILFHVQSSCVKSGEEVTKLIGQAVRIHCRNYMCRHEELASILLKQQVVF